MVHQAKGKMSLFSQPLDLDVMTDVQMIYEPLWARQYLELYKSLLLQETEIQLLQFGESHTLCCTNQDQLFTWGWNGNGQLGSDEPRANHQFTPSEVELPIDIQVHSVAAGDQHSVVLDSDNNIWLWGNNLNGELGLGHCNEVDDLILFDGLPGDEKIIEVQAKGKKTWAVLEDGTVFGWPFIGPDGQIYAQPIELDFPKKARIRTLCCSLNFALFLTTSGLVFSQGRDNSDGQLGHGDTLPRDEPKMIEALKRLKIKVSQIACGYKHVICKSTLGKVFTWGWGERGQLGHGWKKSELIPRMLNLQRESLMCKVL